jgi:acyl-CoA thioesterase-2
VQRGKAIFSMSISFQVDEEGLSHQFAMPEAPGPEALVDENEIRAEQAKSWPPEYQENFSDSSAIQVRPVEPMDLMHPAAKEPQQMVWMKTRERLPDDPRIHQCALAYLSDWSLLDTATLPHAISFLQDNVQMASLDHAMWFHRRFRADEWLLYVQDSPSASGARGFNRGLIYDQSGALVASSTQEGLMRLHD